MAMAYLRVYRKRPVLVIFADNGEYLYENGRTLPISEQRALDFKDNLPWYRCTDIYDPHYEVAVAMRNKAQGALHCKIDVHYDITRDRPLGLMGIEMLFSIPFTMGIFMLWVLGLFFIPGFSELSARWEDKWNRPGTGVNPWYEARPTAYPYLPIKRSTDEWYGFISGS